MCVKSCLPNGLNFVFSVFLFFNLPVCVSSKLVTPVNSISNSICVVNSVLSLTLTMACSCLVLPVLNSTTGHNKPFLFLKYF